MDIASILSPCADTPQRQGGAAAMTPLVVSLDQELVALDHQIVALQSSTPPRKASKGPQTPSVTTHNKKIQRSQGTLLSVKRKRKRNLTVKQLQARSENQRDESQLYNLTLDINDLKQQVRDYMVRKSIHETRSLVNRQRFNAGVIRTTRHFFKVFRVGYREWQPQEAVFLAVTIDQDVVISSDVRGADIFFEQWKRYKKMLQQRYFSVTSIQILVSDLDSCVVECRGEFEGKLTLTAIEALFPHILEDTMLLSKVVNCRLICPTRTLIYFDASGRIVQYDAHADMFAGLSRILAANLLDVITLMSNARISAEGSMIPDAEDVDNNEERRFVAEDDKGPERRDTGSASIPGSPVGSMASSLTSDSPSSRSSSSSRSSVEFILS